MLLRLCQLKSLGPLILILLFTSSCSWWRDDLSGSDLIHIFDNKWFSVNKEHSLVNPDGEPAPHLFFDTTPEFKSEDRTVNTIVMVPAGSQYSYSIDLSSGQRYFSHKYCKQKDVWNLYSGTIGKPYFSIGYIPRVLDQLGEPQKVIIFSKKSGYAENAATNYHKVKIAGAYVEQVCLEGNCLGKSNWLSRLVFIAVDSEDKGLVDIKTTQDFKSEFDWSQAKAYLENIDGRNFMGDNRYPAIRVSKLIEYEDAFDYFKNRAIFMTDKEIKKIQSGCLSLYEKLWDDVGKVRPEDAGAKTIEELNAKLKLREKLRDNRKSVGFAARLRKFTKKYFNEVSTCEKFVYHGNINLNREKFWFLSYMGIFYRLHKDGYYFDCRRKTWQRNVFNRDGKLSYDIKDGIDDCDNGDIDRAMEYMPNFIKSLKGEREFYRFVDYDNHPFGTHQKMYSWVKMKNRRFECSGDDNEEIQKEMRVFPEDTNWIQRDVKDISEKLKIIY